ncbi:hypothetical protein [Parafrankia sp. BMG5.11]|uniref:hypothetical protein n=1 Tax=Parafrankia sp. BMG5.11 TaxID=222540 RepID=UPI00103F4B80|nr:hypothetical protein [Parafrankia sp. BMG5.11]TCJ34562.1 hypothetical protein E0504_31635 [Parafrankia sp. BMG5.11]
MHLSTEAPGGSVGRTPADIGSTDPPGPDNAPGQLGAAEGRESGPAGDVAPSPILPRRTPHPDWAVVELDPDGRVVRVIVGQPEFRNPADADLYARGRGLPHHRVAPVDLGRRVPTGP